MKLEDALATLPDRAERRLPARHPVAANPSAANRIRRQKMETVGRLAGGAAHDINNLLTAIVLNSDVLADTVSDAKLSTLAESTRMCAERAGDLTRQLLAVIREQTLLPRATDVNGVIAALGPLLRRSSASTSTVRSPSKRARRRRCWIRDNSNRRSSTLRSTPGTRCRAAAG